MNERRSILSGSTFEEQIGYARAVVDGEWVHVSGTTGFDYATMTISEDVAQQTKQCLHNIEAALREAGCTFADVVRVRYMLPDRDDFGPCWPALRECFGQVRPAATMLVCGLADPRMKIEIEVDAHAQALRRKPRCWAAAARTSQSRSSVRDIALISERIGATPGVTGDTRHDRHSGDRATGGL